MSGGKGRAVSPFWLSLATLGTQDLLPAGTLKLSAIWSWLRNHGIYSLNTDATILELANYALSQLLLTRTEWTQILESLKKPKSCINCISPKKL